MVGTPVSLLSEPSAACVVAAAASAARASSFVVVLPAEPVIATSLPPQAERWAAASLPYAMRVSSTMIVGAAGCGLRAAGRNRLSTMQATAPFAIAAAQNS